MKIAVYAISKNEAHFVERFCESCKDADHIIIVDTGSTDNTREEVIRCGATLREIAIKPWRFDTARNAALALVPSDVDVCISIDLDEVMTSGWREKLEAVWKLGETTRLRYFYDWSNGLKFYTSKIHARWGYVWNYPCHEYVESDGRWKDTYAFTDELLVVHYPDPTKSRSDYMDLLTCSIKERTDCARSLFYYARELYFNARWAEAEEYLLKAVAWRDRYTDYELDYVRRKLAECYENTGRVNEAQRVLRQSVADCNHIREPWVALANLAYRTHDWAECAYAARKAIKITDRHYFYTDEVECYGYKPFDLLAISSYHLGDFRTSVEMGMTAMMYEPNDERLKKNLDFYNSGAEQHILKTPVDSGLPKLPLFANRTASKLEPKLLANLDNTVWLKM